MARGRSSTSSSDLAIESSHHHDDEPNNTQMLFSQIVPDKSQAITVPKQREVSNLASMERAAASRIVTDLSRILLFKGLSGEPIDRKKAIAEALGDQKNEKVQSAVLDEASRRLSAVFGFDVRRVPSSLEESLPGKFKDRLYLINSVKDDVHGTHSVNIHGLHDDSSLAKGVLMIVLAFAFCKGSPVRSGVMKGAGKNTRWITESQLYLLMNRVDENLPCEPPAERNKSRRDSSGGNGRVSLGNVHVLSQTPDLDSLLEQFVQADYLLKDKIDESDITKNPTSDSEKKVVAYAMGPRANMEIGRRQLVYFCANLLGEQEPDPTMMMEIDEDEEESGEEESGEEEEVVVEDNEKEGKRRRRQ
ncbi:hypothetical protein ACHAXN_008525 [Cyclotella atomus]